MPYHPPAYQDKIVDKRNNNPHNYGISEKIDFIDNILAHFPPT